MTKTPTQQKNLINAKTAFYLFLFTMAVVIVLVWLTGMNIHRTLIANSFYSLSIITFLFFAFVTTGLFKGIGLKDNYERKKTKTELVEPSGIMGDIPDSPVSVDDFASEGIGGILLGILFWIGVTLLLVMFTFLFETIILSGIIFLTGMLYWVFYRATRLVFRYSRLTRNNLSLSLWIGLKYSFLYSGWMYLVIAGMAMVKGG